MNIQKSDFVGKQNEVNHEETKQIETPAPVLQTATVSEPPKAEPPAPAPEPVKTVPAGIDSWIAAAGIAPGDAEYVKYIVFKESSNNPSATNGQAYGLCQALPGSKMASAGSDWATNPVTQLRWCNGYAISRYGSWANAYNVWLTKHWW